MPRLSTNGDAICGVAGVQASINGSVPANLAGMIGNWDWLTPTVAFGQGDIGPGFRLYTYNTATTVLTEVMAVGANNTWAGGGVWQAWLGGTGLFTSTPPGLSIALAGPGSVDATDGAQVVIIDRQSGFGLQVYSSAGALRAAVSTVLSLAEPIKLRSSVLSYVDVGGWHLVNGTTGVVLPYLAATTTVDWLVPAVTGSTVYVLERNVNNELIFRLATQNTGFIVTSGAPTLFYPDVRFLTATTIRIAYSLTVADAAADLVLHDVNIQTGAHSKATVVAGSLVWVPQPALPTLPVPTSGGSAQLLAHAQGVYQQPVVDPTSGGRISVPWYRFLDALVKIVAGPFNLNSGQFVGVLQQPNGGTGTTTGLTNISPPAVQFTQASVLLGRGQGGGAGQGQEITLGSGLTMTGTALSAVVSGLQFVTVDPATPANGDVWFKITGAAGAGELSINVRRNGTTTSIPMASGIP